MTRSLTRSSPGGGVDAAPARMPGHARSARARGGWRGGIGRAGAMVRGGYPIVVQPAAVSFFAPQAEPRQAGTGWRISRCMVMADSGKSMT